MDDTTTRSRIDFDTNALRRGKINALQTPHIINTIENIIFSIFGHFSKILTVFTQ